MVLMMESHCQDGELGPPSVSNHVRILGNMGMCQCGSLGGNHVHDADFVTMARLSRTYYIVIVVMVDKLL